MKRLLTAALALLAACNPAAEGAEAPAPFLAPVAATLERPAYVVDGGGMLSERDALRIAERLRDFQRRTGHQFVVVTIRSTDGIHIADYTRDLGNRWGIGRQDHNDGVILLFATEDRKVRIAVGDGLARQLSNEATAEILRSSILPGLRAHAPGVGVKAGVDAILARLDPPPR